VIFIRHQGEPDLFHLRFSILLLLRFTKDISQIGHLRLITFREKIPNRTQNYLFAERAVFYTLCKEKYFMMTLDLFNALDDISREIEMKRAVRLSGRNKGNYLLLLYQLHSFYLEIHYNKLRHKVTGIEAFDDMARLDPYLEEIEITLQYS
jgi:hypothetical protein